MPLTFLYQSVIRYALLVFFLIKLFYYVYMIFIDKQFCACQLKYKEQTFHIFSTSTLCCLYLFSLMKIQVLLYFHIFSTLTWSRLYLFSSMKIQVLLHFHIFSTLTLSQLYLFSSMKIPRLYLGTNLLHFPFFPLWPWVSFTSFHRWKYQEHTWNRFISGFFVLLGIKSLLTYLIKLNSLF